MAQAETGDLGTAQHVRSVLQALAIPKDSFTYEADAFDCCNCGSGGLRTATHKAASRVRQ